eukprot:TRINITY_DN3183_c0_g2_i3.p2 TRINITY_DN3183_c0_g2~~TRINITY_DN3183_c0_g2_i3.p2  ORF type:complete len:111 (+),score=2.80 TRINITY_DN3183_c0_g2_i3:151-483(+)
MSAGNKIRFVIALFRRLQILVYVPIIISHFSLAEDELRGLRIFTLLRLVQFALEIIHEKHFPDFLLSPAWLSANLHFMSLFYCLKHRVGTVDQPEPPRYTKAQLPSSIGR